MPIFFVAAADAISPPPLSLSPLFRICFAPMILMLILLRLPLLPYAIRAAMRYAACHNAAADTFTLIC